MTDEEKVATLEARVKELEDKLKAAEAEVQEVTRLDMVQIAMLEGQVAELMAWKERAIKWMNKNSDCPREVCDDKEHDCAFCRTAYFEEDKP
jgi:chromosome segregation ATPase